MIPHEDKNISILLCFLSYHDDISLLGILFDAILAFLKDSTAFVYE